MSDTPVPGRAPAYDAIFAWPQQISAVAGSASGRSVPPAAMVYPPAAALRASFAEVVAGNAGVEAILPNHGEELPSEHYDLEKQADLKGIIMKLEDQLLMLNYVLTTVLACQPSGANPQGVDAYLTRRYMEVNLAMNRKKMIQSLQEQLKAANKEMSELKAVLATTETEVQTQVTLKRKLEVELSEANKKAADEARNVCSLMESPRMDPTIMKNLQDENAALKKEMKRMGREYARKTSDLNKQMLETNQRDMVNRAELARLNAETDYKQRLAGQVHGKEVAGYIQELETKDQKIARLTDELQKERRARKQMEDLANTLHGENFALKLAVMGGGDVSSLIGVQPPPPAGTAELMQGEPAHD